MKKESKNGKPIEILLVDDDPQDVELTMEIMEQSKVKININVVNDGLEAINYLKKVDNQNGIIKPDLILLDLNMPKMNGHEVLQKIKKNPDFKTIPIVILTTSSNDEDIHKTYHNGANCYVTKPVGMDAFQKVVEAVENFWFTVVKFPSNL
jgi:two-component system response regulator